MPPLSCGGQSCDPGTQQCCVQLGMGGGPGGATESCVPQGQCNNGVALSCTQPSDCPGNQVCCLGLAGGGPSAMCQTRCRRGIQLCSSNQDCPNGERCRMTPFGLSACSGRGGG
jgi:hypothetical protein